MSDVWTGWESMNEDIFHWEQPYENVGLWVWEWIRKCLVNGEVGKCIEIRNSEISHLVMSVSANTGNVDKQNDIKKGKVLESYLWLCSWSHSPVSSDRSHVCVSTWQTCCFLSTLVTHAARHEHHLCDCVHVRWVMFLILFHQFLITHCLWGCFVTFRGAHYYNNNFHSHYHFHYCCNMTMKTSTIHYPPTVVHPLILAYFFLSLALIKKRNKKII